MQSLYNLTLQLWRNLVPRALFKNVPEIRTGKKEQIKIEGGD